MDLIKLDLKQAKDGLRAKKFSSEEITKAFLSRIKQVDPQINAYVTVSEDEALAQARKADEMIANGEDLPLLGIPVSVKDNFCTQGIKTTASSKLLSNFIPPYDATVVEKLKRAGSVILGKTNMDAWAHGSSTETSDFGTTKNPYDLKRLPGGSSGGAAASVSADEAILGIGSETAGSIRQPAAWCGVVGLKPTYGRVSRYGVIAMASSLDCPGPITKSVADAAIVLEVLAGVDQKDATSSPKKVEQYSTRLDRPLNGLRIGVSEDYFVGVSDEIRDAVKKAIEELVTQGAKVLNIKLFDPKYAIAVYTILQRSEVSSNLARFDGVRFGGKRNLFGSEAKRRIMLGTYALSSGYYDQFYNKASKVRTVIVEDFKNAFEQVDIVIAPTAPVTALPIGAAEKSAMFGELMDVLVEPSSIAGLPGINITCGFDKKSLPIGMQIIGPQFAEELILNVAFKYEQVSNWKKVKPKII